MFATRHLVCTAARPAEAAPFAPAWRSETVMALARGVVADHAFDRLPILADALEEAGCDDPMTLRHCRECRQHADACWVMGDLFDRPPVVEPEQMPDWQVRREVEEVTGRPLVRSRGGPPLGTSWWAWKLVPLLLVVGLAFWFRFAYRQNRPVPSYSPLRQAIPAPITPVLVPTDKR